MPSQHESLIAELESSVQSSSSDQRLGTLRRVADLFLNDSDRLNDDQVKVFDDVLCHLIKEVESKALVELSGRLAPIEKAPDAVIRQLAHHDEITVAGPVLAESRKLTTAELAEIARTKGQQHLLAISGREGLEEAVTDVLVERGNREVVVRLAVNSTVRFSEAGYGTLVRRAEKDDLLTEKVGLRRDVPPWLQRELLTHATKAVRARLLVVAPPEAREQIAQVLCTISSSVAGEVGKSADLAAAEERVRQMQAQGRLDEMAVLGFASARKHDELAVAIALLCAAPVKTVSELISGLRNDAVLIPCKAAGLAWPTVEAVLRNRLAGYAVTDQVIELARNDYIRLSIATARRTLRFLQVRANAA
jgi:uncharacterized protein (DUF2336 family)